MRAPLQVENAPAFCGRRADTRLQPSEFQDGQSLAGGHNNTSEKSALAARLVSHGQPRPPGSCPVAAPSTLTSH